MINTWDHKLHTRTWWEIKNIICKKKKVKYDYFIRLINDVISHWITNIIIMSLANDCFLCDIIS